VAVDPKLLAEYEALTVKATKLQGELEEVEHRREEIRKMLLGATPEVVQAFHEAKLVKDNAKKGLSAWERLRREPPEGIKSTVAVVKELGRATNKQVAEKLDIPTSAASLRLSRAARDGWLRRVAHGYYEVEPLAGVMTPKKK